MEIRSFNILEIREQILFEGGMILLRMCEGSFQRLGREVKGLALKGFLEHGIRFAKIEIVALSTYFAHVHG